MDVKVNRSKSVLVGVVGISVFGLVLAVAGYNLNKKIEVLSAQVEKNNSQTDGEIRLQGDALSKSLIDIGDIKNQLSNITYKPGFIAKLEIPPATEESLESIEKELNTPGDWGAGQILAKKLNEEFSALISPMPSWQVEELKPRLYAARWAINSLAIVSQPEAENLDELTKQLDVVQQQITSKPEGLYEDLASSLSKENKKYLMNGLSLASKNANDLINANSQDREQLDKSIAYLNRFSDGGNNDDVEKISASISSMIDVINLSSKIDGLSEDLRKIEKTNQSDLISIAVAQTEQSLADMKMYAFKNNLLSNSALVAKFGDLKDSIVKIQSDLEKDNKKLDDEKIRSYQVWALNQIKSVRSLDEILDGYKDSIPSAFDRDNPLSKASKQAKAASQDELLSEMVKFLSPINQNLLDNAVAQWYQIIYQKRFKELDEDHQLELVEQFAVADKRGVE